MFLLYPTLYLQSIHDITISLLKKIEAKALFVDVDNTLAMQDDPRPVDGAVSWVKNVISNGIEIVIISNNFKDRVSSFANLFNVPSVSFAKKPLPTAFLQARTKLENKSIKLRECIVVGDQVITDILGANLCGIQSILLAPIADRHSKFFVPQKKIEMHVRKKLEHLINEEGFVNTV